jgi:hypothetical protein
VQNDHRIARHSIFHTAGWLFADLLLALTIIFIAAATTGKALPKVVLHPTPTPTSLAPTPTPTKILQALDPHPLKFTMNVDPSQLGQSSTIAYVQDQVTHQLDQSNNGSRKVGFVITLAGGVAGVNHATSLNAILMSMPPFRGAVFKNYHNLDNPDTEFDLEIYFFT